MKIYLFLDEKIYKYTLPKSIDGSYRFDPNSEEDNKLINIEAKDNSWYIYSTVESQILINDSCINSVKLTPNSFYTIKRNNKIYLIYTEQLFSNDFRFYNYNDKLDITISRTNNSSIQYDCIYLKDFTVRIYYSNNKIILENTGMPLYVNNEICKKSSITINTGDLINIYGLKIYFVNNLLLMNNPGMKLNFQNAANIFLYTVEKDFAINEQGIQSVELSDNEIYFSKSPRIKRNYETKKIKISPPPQVEENKNPLMLTILTVAPMIAMEFTSILQILEVLNSIRLGETTLAEAWPTLISYGLMIISSLFLPYILEKYMKNLDKKRRKGLEKKYNKYLEDKEKLLEEEVFLHKNILIENLVSTDNCYDIAINKKIEFWNNSINDIDFLVGRIGIGQDYSKIEIDREIKEEFSENDNSKFDNKIEEIVKKYEYIEDVPVGYSFCENKFTAIMNDNKNLKIDFINNILLQFLTFYSYDELKIVVFTNENDKNKFEYLKYCNHNFSNDKKIRFFSSDTASSIVLSNYLNDELNARNKKENNDEQERLKPHYLIIVDGYDNVRELSFINNFNSKNNNIGMNIVILEEKMSKLPSGCSNYIYLNDDTSIVLKNSYGSQNIIKFKAEVNPNINYYNFVRAISNVLIELEERESMLANSITFLEMEKVGKVEQLNILNRWNDNNATTSLKAEIGINNRKDLIYLDLHEKYHGPHGLIAGTTGSGKSEFIITFILSLCINYSPDDVSFVLIDYKGGGLALAFENKLTGKILPHLAGTITNLDIAEMNRTLVSIDSEIKRRQVKFNEARDRLGEGTIDIYKYQTLYKEGKIKEPISHLFIICDEFAELKAQQPEFMSNLISVARIGRSLGVHLILATQKPSGVVDDQIWSNSKFKVCLKVQDESDSNEMLKKPNAAHITQAGRFYLQVGYDEIFELGQSGWCGAKYYPSNKIIKEVDKSINYIDETGNIIKTLKEDDGIKLVAQGEQLNAIMDEIIKTANGLNKKADKLWLDNVPEIILVDELIKKYNIKYNKYDVNAIIGEYDAPEIQKQGIVTYNYLENGNTIIYSQDTNDFDMFYDSMIYSTTKYHDAGEICYYIMDYGTDSLAKYEKLPQVGDVVLSQDKDKFKNLFKLIHVEKNKRKKLLIDFGGNFLNYQKNNTEKLPILCIILNNFENLLSQNDSIIELLPEVMRDSSRFGISFIISCVSPNSLTSNITQLINTTYAYKLKDKSDYRTIFEAKENKIPKDIDGRGILSNGALHEFQTSNIIDSENGDEEYLRNFIKTLNENSTIFASKIPILPNHVGYDIVKPSINDINNIPIGMEKESLEILGVNLLENRVLMISAMKSSNMINFMNSFTYVLNGLNNTTLIVLDPLKRLNINKEIIKNYYNENLGLVIKTLKDYITNLIENNSTNNVIFLINNFVGLKEILKNEVIIEDNATNNFETTEESYEENPEANIEITDTYSDNDLDFEEEENDDDSFTFDNDSLSFSELSGNKDYFIEFYNHIKDYPNCKIIVSEEASKLDDIKFDENYNFALKDKNGLWIGRGVDYQNIFNTDSLNFMNLEQLPDSGYYCFDGDVYEVKLIDFYTKDDGNEE